ncbi:MAG: hypothetical protein AB2A00_34555 [Myxococcota bacterium]
MARPTEPLVGFGPSVHQRVRKFTGDAPIRAPRREMPMGARREALAAARKIRLSPLLSRPDLDALERGLELLDELCGPLPPTKTLDQPLWGPAELKELTELLPELNKLVVTRDPLFVHHLAEWRKEKRPHSEMALRLRIGFACGYLPVDPQPKDASTVPWEVRDLQVVEPVAAALPAQLKKLGNLRTLRLAPLAPEVKELQEVKEEWRRTADRDKANITARMAKVKGMLRVRLLAEPLPAALGTDEVRGIHVPGELLAISKLRGLRGVAALGILYALSEEHYRQDERERALFDQKLERAMRRERMADDPARAYALAVTAFAVAPSLVEEKWPKTHTHMLDRFDTSLAAFDGGALLRPAMESLLALR